MTDNVTKLHVLDKDNNIFNIDTAYVIPLYQRAYAWENEHLVQLIKDINDVEKNDDYCIGSLIVSKQSGQYEVIDGQQRLTALYLLLNCLGMRVAPRLVFACREKSNYTLKNIQDLISENSSKLDGDKIEKNILKGIKIVLRELQKPSFDKEAFIEKLSRVVIYRIEVPKHTDLNRYFEIMNTRGEQLEQHDILKAKLMSWLDKSAERAVFAQIWDACSDMSGYVQMHFNSQNNTLREAIFGSQWNHIPSQKWNDYQEVMQKDGEETIGYTMHDLIDDKFKIEDDDGYLDEDVRIRFESIITFPYFLLHTLKVYINLYGIEHKDGRSKVIKELLDDNKLLDSFNDVIENGVRGNANGEKERLLKKDFAQEFIICLLRTRYLFDKYIIKREYANNNSDGEWSLKSLYVSGWKSNKKAYYKNTAFLQSDEELSSPAFQKNMMIQSALRVSYISPKIMHWITKLLIWLSSPDNQNEEHIIRFNTIAEDIAKEAVKQNFFDVCSGNKYEMGVHTPHIVFNYLDYLLWENNKKKYGDFVFEFRNSVEHWYPRNPSEGTEKWTDGVDRFGNLCIIQQNVNSKFSNMPPEAKKITFGKRIGKESLKLRIMSELTEKNNELSASNRWKAEICQEHEKEMIAILKGACNVA